MIYFFVEGLDMNTAVFSAHSPSASLSVSSVQMKMLLLWREISFSQCYWVYFCIFHALNPNTRRSESWPSPFCCVSQCLRGDQTEGLHQLGHRSECGWPDRKPHKEHEPDPSCFHHGAGKGCIRMFWINKYSVYVNQAVALYARSKRVLFSF